VIVPDYSDGDLLVAACGTGTCFSGTAGVSPAFAQLDSFNRALVNTMLEAGETPAIPIKATRYRSSRVIGG
jgi:hypothetical protein